VERWQPCAVTQVQHDGAQFLLETGRGPVQTAHLVIATGGLSIPKIGATDWGLRVAKQFGHSIVEPRAALVPLTFAPDAWAPFSELSGLALPVQLSTGQGKQRMSFLEDLLFTHRGLSGPAILQISSFWSPGQAIEIDLLPGIDLVDALKQAKSQSRRQLGNELSEHMPQRLAQTWLKQQGLDSSRPMAECKDKDLVQLAQSLKAWRLTPDGSEGWRKAEVMRGGVNTRELSSQSMESRLQAGLYFIGEVVDVTGWLGGYNFQWAWASAVACAQAIHGSQG